MIDFFGLNNKDKKRIVEEATDKAINEQIKLMKKTINCECCNGTGKKEIRVCDKCGSDFQVNDDNGRDICFNCWGKTLTDEEINNL